MQKVRVLYALKSAIQWLQGQFSTEMNLAAVHLLENLQNSCRGMQQDSMCRGFLLAVPGKRRFSYGNSHKRVQRHAAFNSGRNVRTGCADVFWSRRGWQIFLLVPQRPPMMAQRSGHDSI
jgi:hypothetical protein